MLGTFECILWTLPHSMYYGSTTIVKLGDREYTANDMEELLSLRLTPELMELFK